MCVCVQKLNIEHTVDRMNAIMQTLGLKKVDAAEEIKIQLQPETSSTEQIPACADGNAAIQR